MKKSEHIHPLPLQEFLGKIALSWMSRVPHLIGSNGDVGAHLKQKWQYYLFLTRWNSTQISIIWYCCERGEMVIFQFVGCPHIHGSCIGKSMLCLLPFLCTSNRSCSRAPVLRTTGPAAPVRGGAIRPFENRELCSEADRLSGDSLNS